MNANENPVYWKSILRDIAIDVRLGVHAHEQSAPQPVRVSVELLHLRDDPGIGRTLNSVIDYDTVRDFVLRWQAKSQVSLIEELLLELVGFCFENPRVDAVKASVLKTAIFAEVREAGVEAFFTREAWGLRNA